MVFSSTVFLFIFLPAAYLIYLALPNTPAKNAWLILVSLVFYAYGEPITVLLMVFSVLANYAFARVIASPKSAKKPWLACAVVFNLAILGVFKYAGFFVRTINSILPLDLAVPNIRLPIGISFFTFQILSYVIDVYKDPKAVQKNFFNVLLYISLFPQLIAGPIVKYGDVSLQIGQRSVTPEAAAAGVRLFIVGLSKKVLIANTVGAVSDAMFGLANDDMSILTCWLGGIAYTLQIYFDFSGYSDMAIGLGSMLGFVFPKNFDHPYTADSIQMFWRKWHISLSSWFKEYLYIPLGGNRRGKFRTAVNKIIVFFCTGLWHGANMTFVVWGLLHGLFLMLESYKVIPLEKIKFKAVKHIYTMLVVCVTFVIFRADTLTQAMTFISKMFTGVNISQTSLNAFTSQFSPLFCAVLALAAVCSMPIGDKLRSLAKRTGTVKLMRCSSYAASLALLALCVISLASSTFNPFIYLQF